MDSILKICFCVILIGIYWISIADSQSQCQEVGYFRKCQVCEDDKSCPKCENVSPNLECGHENRCRCKQGYGRSGGFLGCVKATTIVKHGDVCDSSQNILCNATDDVLTCSRTVGRCVCSGRYQRDDEVGRCIRSEGLIFDACSAKPDTCNKFPPTLKCVKNRCLVKKGFKYNCITEFFERGKREHNETCNEVPCSTVQPGCDPCNPNNHLECKNGNDVCDCKSGYYWNQIQGICIAGLPTTTTTSPLFYDYAQDGDEYRENRDRGMSLVLIIIISIIGLVVVVIMTFFIIYYFCSNHG